MYILSIIFKREFPTCKLQVPWVPLLSSALSSALSLRRRQGANRRYYLSDFGGHQWAANYILQSADNTQKERCRSMRRNYQTISSITVLPTVQKPAISYSCSQRAAIEHFIQYQQQIMKTNNNINNKIWKQITNCNKVYWKFVNKNSLRDWFRLLRLTLRCNQRRTLVDVMPFRIQLPFIRLKLSVRLSISIKNMFARIIENPAVSFFKILRRSFFLREHFCGT